MKKNLVFLSFLLWLFTIWLLCGTKSYAIDCGNAPATWSYTYTDYAKINAIIQKQIDSGLKNNAAVYTKYKAEYTKIKNPTQRQKYYYTKLLYSLQNYNGNVVNAYTKNKKNYVEFDFFSYPTSPSNWRGCWPEQSANQSKKTRIYEVDKNVKIKVTVSMISCEEIASNPNDYQSATNDPYFKKWCGKFTFSEWTKFGCGKEGTVYRPNYMGSCVSNPTKWGRYELQFTNGKVSSLTEGYSD